VIFRTAGSGGALWVQRDSPDFRAHSHSWARTDSFLSRLSPLSDGKQHPEVYLTQQQLEAEIKATLEEEGDRSARTNPPQKKNPKNLKERDLRQRGQVPSYMICTRLEVS